MPVMTTSFPVTLGGASAAVVLAVVGRCSSVCCAWSTGAGVCARAICGVTSAIVDALTIKLRNERSRNTDMLLLSPLQRTHFFECLSSPARCNVNVHFVKRRILDGGLQHRQMALVAMGGKRLCSTATNEDVRGQPALAGVPSQRHIGWNDPRMEQAALKDNHSVREGLDCAYLLEKIVRAVEVTRARGQLRDVNLRDGLEDGDIQFGHSLDTRCALAVKSCPRVGRRAKVMQQSEILLVGGVEMRRSLRRRQLRRFQGHHREAGFNEIEDVDVEGIGDKR